MKKISKLMFAAFFALASCYSMSAQVPAGTYPFYSVYSYGGGLSAATFQFYVNIPTTGLNQLDIVFNNTSALQIVGASASGLALSNSTLVGNNLVISVDPNYVGTPVVYLTVVYSGIANCQIPCAQINCTSVLSGPGGFAVGNNFNLNFPFVTGGFGWYSVKTFPSPANEYVDLTVETPEESSRTEFIASKFQRQNFVEQLSYKVRIIDVANGTEVDSFEVKNLKVLPRVETSAYKVGMYSVVIEQNGKTISSSKFVVKH
ncbi:MAG: hypothetical protein MUF71_05250 [Candidatus Kapabacteria bacterium]|jgi:hypothetical protein|nr:hypothetical protein [Candidatus Kapabacteria bacterium]